MYFSLLRSIIVITFLSALQFSCAPFFTSESRTSRGKLSEAVKKSSDDYKGPRKVADSKTTGKINRGYCYNEKYGSTRSGYISDCNPVKVQVRTYEPPEKLIRDSTDYIQEKDSTDENLNLIDSSGDLNLSNYILQLSLPFTIKSDIKQITISTIDTSGKQNELVLQKAATENDTIYRHDSCVASETAKPSGEWVVTERHNVHYFGIKTFTGLKYSSKYSNITGGSVLWAYHFRKKQRSALFCGAAIIPIPEESDLFGSIGKLTQMHLGYQHRIYFTPDYTIFGIYLPVDASLKLVFWKYNNPIVTDVYGEDDKFLYSEKIKDDGLLGLSLGTGIGFSFIRSRFVRLSGEATLGGTVYRNETVKNFTNDIFISDAYLMLSLECVFGISMVGF